LPYGYLRQKSSTHELGMAAPNTKWSVSSFDSSDSTPVDPSYIPKALNTAGESISEHSGFESERCNAKILVLYCGGTIGMRSHDGGNFFELTNIIPKHNLTCLG